MDRQWHPAEPTCRRRRELRDNEDDGDGDDVHCVRDPLPLCDRDFLEVGAAAAEEEEEDVRSRSRSRSAAFQGVTKERLAMHIGSCYVDSERLLCSHCPAFFRKVFFQNAERRESESKVRH